MDAKHDERSPVDPADKEKMRAQRLELIKQRHRALILQQRPYDDDEWDAASDWDMDSYYDYQDMKMLEESYGLEAM